MKNIILLLFIVFSFSSCYQSKLTLTKGNKTKTFNEKSRLTFFTTDVNANGDSIKNRIKARIVSSGQDSIKLKPITMRQTIVLKDKRKLTKDTSYCRDTTTYTSISKKSVTLIHKQRMVLNEICKGTEAVTFTMFMLAITSAQYSEKSEWPLTGKIIGVSLATFVAVVLLDCGTDHRSFYTGGKNGWIIK